MKHSCIVLTLLLLFWATFAYQPTADDAALLRDLKIQLNQSTSWNMQQAWNFYYQIKSLQEQYPENEKISYLLNELDTHIVAKITTEKTKAKIASKQFKQDFLQQYTSWISIDITTADSCTWWYNTIDNLSFANNFPTALTLATRYRETNCWYYLPRNWRGPFQITSNNYGTGEITESTFIKSIQDFIDFSKAKHARYKTALGITMDYNSFDYTWIINHSALYNWATISSWVAVPNAPTYVFDWYTTYTWATRYWVFPKFLKMLQWELETNY